MRFLAEVAASVWSTLVAVALGCAAAIMVARLLFGLSLTGAIAFYFVIWWIVLFVLLPLGARSQHEEGMTVPGTEPGAPVMPRIRERAILTTALADVVFLVSVMLLPLAGL